MKFEELQQAWDAIKVEPKSHDELRKMMYAPRRVRLRKLTEREFIELSGVAFYIAILVVDGYIGYIAAFGIWGLISFLDQYFGLRYLRFFPLKESVYATLISSKSYIRRRQTISYLTNFLIWITLAFVLGFGGQGGIMNVVRWAFILLPVLGSVVWWIARTWAKKNNNAKELLRDLSDDAV